MEYIKPNVTKAWLLQNGFRYNRIYSTDKSDVYTYRFPVYKYEKFTTLECELAIYLEDGNVVINVFDYGTNNKYAPYYYLEYENYIKILDVIYEKINRELKRLKIERVKRKSDKKGER